jgi:hypothetical protein
MTASPPCRVPFLFLVCKTINLILSKYRFELGSLWLVEL